MLAMLLTAAVALSTLCKFAGTCQELGIDTLFTLEQNSCHIVRNENQQTGRTNKRRANCYEIS